MLHRHFKNAILDKKLKGAIIGYCGIRNKSPAFRAEGLEMRKEELIEELENVDVETVLVETGKGKEIKLKDLKIESLKIYKDVVLIPLREPPTATLSIHLKDLLRII